MKKVHVVVESLLIFKKIMSDAPNGMDSVVIGIDKSGCSGYAYK